MKVHAGTDDYPSEWKNLPMDSVFDSWGMYNRQCTSFVAWRLHSKNKFDIPFHDDASNWADRAKNLGYPVNETPAVGAVAWTSSHVAWVEAISGSNVTVEEYNNVDSNGNGIYGDDGTYSTRTVAASKFQYIHFKDIASGDSGSTQSLNAQFIGRNVLSPGERLNAGQYILSNNAQYALVMQTDGNLVLYGPKMKALWSSGTSGQGAAFAAMQTDGNFVLYRSNNAPVWSTQTNGRGESTAVMQDDGNFVVYAKSGTATWHTATGGHPTYSYFGANKLNAGQTLNKGQYIRSSDKRLVALMQTDGNLVIYGPAYEVHWHTRTGDYPGARLVMQGDGNLVVYYGSTAVWNSGTTGTNSAYAIMQNDANLVTYTAGGKATWSYKTGRL